MGNLIKLVVMLIGGGIVVARRGLGRNPLRIIVIANLVNWSVCSVFALRSSGSLA